MKDQHHCFASTDAALTQPGFDGQQVASGSLAAASVRPLKVLLLVTELEDYAIAFANGLARHLRVMLGVPARQYRRLAGWLDPEVDLRLLDWPRHRSAANARFLVSLTRLVRDERPDVVHLLSNNSLWLNLALPLWRHIPIVTTVHDVSVHPGDTETGVLPRWATSLIARQSGDLVVHGARLKQLAATEFNKQEARVHVLPHPAILRYAELGRRIGYSPAPKTGTFTVLLFGRIFAYKGLQTLIRAEALLGSELPGLRIVVAGRGDDPWSFQHLMGRRERYDVRHRFIEDAEVARLFIDADAVVLPYSEASQSGVLHVAGSFGKPAIVTDVGELGATVAARTIGLVVPPDDPAALAHAISLMAARPDLRSVFGANALAFAEGDNSPQAVGAIASALYRSLSRGEVPA